MNCASLTIFNDNFNADLTSQKTTKFSYICQFYETDIL